MALPTVDGAAALYAKFPLANASEEIRVVTLQHTSDLETPLTASIKIIPIPKGISSDLPSGYQVLSHAWDTHERTEELWIEGYKMLITLDLSLALRRIRKSIKPHKTHSPTEEVPTDGEEGLFQDDTSKHETIVTGELWNDAICINHADPCERPQQAAAMRQIYTYTDGLLCWLGEGSDEDVSAIMSNELPDFVDERTRQAIQKLFTRSSLDKPWFRQEIMLAPRARQYGLYGSMFTPLPDLLQYATLLASSSLHFAAPVGSTAERSHISGDNIKEGSLLRNIFCFQDPQLQNLRDRFYSLLDFSYDTATTDVDYSRSTDDLYLHLAKKWTQTDQTFLLVCSTFCSNESNLPSWVPDWRHIIPSRNRHHSDVALLLSYPIVKDKLQALAASPSGSKFTKPRFHDQMQPTHPEYNLDTKLTLWGRIIKPCQHRDDPSSYPTCSCCVFVSAAMRGNRDPIEGLLPHEKILWYDGALIGFSIEQTKVGYHRLVSCFLVVPTAAADASGILSPKGQVLEDSTALDELVPTRVVRLE